MKPQDQVFARSEETGRVLRLNRAVAERHDTLTILDDEDPDLRAEVAREDADPGESTTSEQAADVSAAFVADDNEEN